MRRGFLLGYARVAIVGHAQVGICVYKHFCICAYAQVRIFFGIASENVGVCTCWYFWLYACQYFGVCGSPCLWVCASRSSCVCASVSFACMRNFVCLVCVCECFGGCVETGMFGYARVGFVGYA